MNRTRRAARGFALVTAVPLAAALLTVRPEVAQADPELPGLPSVGEILSGSAGSDPAAGPIDAPTGSGLGLGTGSSYSGSGAGGGASSGSSLGLAPNPVVGGGLSTGSAVTGSAAVGSGITA